MKERSFASLKVASSGIPANLVRPRISQPDACAIVSINSTPGINGMPGKCPSKIVECVGTFASALIVRAAPSMATMRSMSLKYSSCMRH
jgi:hypothetical protein